MRKIDKQRGYIVQHREIQPLFCNNFKWNIIYKNIASLCYTPETNKTERRGNIRVGEWEIQTTGYKIGSKMYCTTWEYGQYFVITVNGK